MLIGPKDGYHLGPSPDCMARVVSR